MVQAPDWGLHNFLGNRLNFPRVPVYNKDRFWLVISYFDYDKVDEVCVKLAAARFATSTR